MTAHSLRSDVTVIGGGLSGLASAVLLQDAGCSVRILEAYKRHGGRIQSIVDPDTRAFVADLGPTWVWPAYQPTVRGWLEKLELDTFPQYDAGQAISDRGPGEAPQVGFMPGQEGIARIVGGSQAVVDALLDRLSDHMVVTDSPVGVIDTSGDGVSTTCLDGTSFVADCVLVTAAPRVALRTIDWQNALPASLAKAMRAMPTWMAPHAKAVALYAEPFWRANGLSGRIASRVGPLVEAHDHCGPDGSPAALFGFIGWPYEVRRQAAATLEGEIRNQLKRCFGADMPEPTRVHIEDWSQNRYTATPDDLNGAMHHPSVGPDVLRQPHCNGKVWFAGAENALQSPGLIEGAFDAAERAVSNIVGLPVSLAAD